MTTVESQYDTASAIELSVQMIDFTSEILQICLIKVSKEFIYLFFSDYMSMRKTYNIEEIFILGSIKIFTM